MDDFNNLKVKKKTNESINGKPKVYYCSHPEDFNLYFEIVTDDILKLQGNVAVFYMEPGKEEQSLDNTRDMLKEMQLIVVPVTERFLKESSYARDVEIRAAMDMNIPVLPLMQEMGLDREFSRVFGNLQYLDKDASRKDATALPFEERLKKYLEAVLLNDSTIESVRSAFDAYIFLSYRKKDRKYAQQIMKKIHENSFCRDVAIWYDEFLTPGEDFNEGISDAMNKSRLIALAVTPNLLEKPNYVMDTEYPYAQKSGINILPIEAQKTDEDELKRCYLGINNLVGTDDGEMLSNSLRDIFPDIADKNADEDKYHLYYMGLAYLYGIDVEVDSERGIDLLEKSAGGNGIILEGSGIPEAACKLVDVYENGIGTSRNYMVAKRWQLHLLSMLYDRFNKEQTQDSWRAAFDGTKKLIMLSIASRDLEGAAHQVKQLFKFSDFYASKEWENAKEIKLEASLLYINVTMQLGITKELLEKISEGVDVARELFSLKPTLRNCRMAREMYLYAGKTFVNSLSIKQEGLFNLYKNAIYISKSILRSSDNTVSDEYSMLSILLEAAQTFTTVTMWDEAKKLCDEAADYIRMQMDGQSSEELDAIECKIHMISSRIKSHFGDFESAGEEAKTSYDIADRLFEISECAEYTILLGESSRQIADVLFDMGEYEKACKKYLMAKYHYLALASGGENVLGARGFFECENMAMLSCIKNDDYEAAFAVYDQERKYTNHIFDKFDFSEKSKFLASTFAHYCMTLGDMENSRRNDKAAFEFYESALNTVREALKLVKERDTYFAFYECCKKLYEATKADDYKRYALKIITELAQRAPHIEVYQKEKDAFLSSTV